MVSKWHDRKEAIQRMVKADLTDEQIGVNWGVSGATICTVRKKLGIPSKYNAKFKRENQPSFGSADPKAELLAGEPCEDENGQKFTRYPARYARNAGVQTVTARPRR